MVCCEICGGGCSSVCYSWVCSVVWYLLYFGVMCSVLMVVVRLSGLDSCVLLVCS